MKTSIFCLLFCLAINATAQNKPQVTYKARQLYSGSIAGAQTDSTEWFAIGDSKYFNLFVTLSTDSTFFVDAISDSLGFDIDYKLHHGYTRPTKATAGFIDKSTGAAHEIMSFAVADTANVRVYESLNTGTAAVSPTTYIQFYLVKDATHVKLTTKSLNAELILWRQN